MYQVIESFKGTKKKRRDEVESYITHLFSPLSARHINTNQKEFKLYEHVCLPPQLIFYAINNLLLIKVFVERDTDRIERYEMILIKSLSVVLNTTLFLQRQ